MTSSRLDNWINLFSSALKGEKAVISEPKLTEERRISGNDFNLKISVFYSFWKLKKSLTPAGRDVPLPFFCSVLRCFCATKIGRFCAVLRCEFEILRILRCFALCENLTFCAALRCFARFFAAQNFCALRCSARFPRTKKNRFLRCFARFFAAQNFCAFLSLKIFNDQSLCFMHKIQKDLWFISFIKHNSTAAITLSFSCLMSQSGIILSVFWKYPKIAQTTSDI